MAFGISAGVWMAGAAGLAAGSIMSADSPDMSGVNQSASDSAKLGRDQFDWYKAEYAKTQPQRDAAIAQAGKVSDAQLEGMNFATDQARQLDARNKAVFQPVENQIVADAQTYDTGDRRTQAANEATAGVEASFGRAQEGLDHNLARMGVAPGSGKSLSLMQDASLAKARATAGATTMATRNVEQQGYARKMDAAALGKGIVGSQATMQQIAQSGGAQAVSASGAAVSAANSGAGLMQTGFSGAMQGAGQAGSLYGQAARLDQASNDSTMQGIGQMAGLATKLYLAQSDKGIKSNTNKPADTKASLKGIVDTPVKAGWKYDAGKGGVDDGGRPHDGPMAQEVRKHMGSKVAPGGKQIDLVSMNGQLMAGMQELAKRMTKLERRSA